MQVRGAIQAVKYQWGNRVTTKRRIRGVRIEPHTPYIMFTLMILVTHIFKDIRNIEWLIVGTMVCDIIIVLMLLATFFGV